VALDEEVVQYWRRFFESDQAERDLMLESTIAEHFDSCRAIDDKRLRLHCYAVFLRGYIEDATEVYRLLYCGDDEGGEER